MGDYREAVDFLQDINNNFEVDEAKFLQSKEYRNAVNIIAYPMLSVPVVLRAFGRSFSNVNVQQARRELTKGDVDKIVQSEVYESSEGSYESSYYITEDESCDLREEESASSSDTVELFPH